MFRGYKTERKKIKVENSRAEWWIQQLKIYILLLLDCHLN
jgi:hypothetical protein